MDGTNEPGRTIDARGAMGVQFGDHNEQHNYFSIQRLFYGPTERLQDVCFDPEPLERDLDLAHFTGRGWLIDQIDAFIAANPRGYLILQGEAGVGKSTLAAYLVRTRPWLHHFTRLPGGRAPQAARKSLAAQLIGQWRLAKAWAPDGIMPSASRRPDWFSRLLHAAARERDRSAPDEPIVLVVDGLDEADEDPDAASGTLPLGLPSTLPDGVYVVATTRFGVDRALHALRRPVAWLELNVAAPSNMADIRQYISNVTAPGAGDGLLRSLQESGTDLKWFRKTAAQACAGVWIYLRYVLDEIRDGVRDPRSIAGLPADLAGYYAEQLERWRGAPDDERARHEWKLARLPLLGVLGAAQAPLTLEELASFAGALSAEQPRIFLEQTMRAFLDLSQDETGQRRYALRHQSLRDLFESSTLPQRPDIADLSHALATEVQGAHRAITTALTPPGEPGVRDWTDAGDYLRRHLAAHAAAGGSFDDLLCDPGFLLVAAPGSILTQRSHVRTLDGRRAFAAFEMSLHDWNPKEKHQSLTRLAANAARLHADALNAAYRRSTDGEWKPSWVSWGGRQHRKLVGGRDIEAAVIVGVVADRSLIVSASYDGEVRIWDAVIGEIIGKTLLHDSPVMAVALGHVGDRQVIVTGSEDGMARVWDAVSHDLIDAPLQGHEDAVNAVAIGRIGGEDVIVTGSGDKTVRIWNAASLEPVGAPLSGHQGKVRTLAMGRVGGRDVVVSGSDDKTVRVWDASAGFQVKNVLHHARPVETVVISAIAHRDVIVTNSFDRRELGRPPFDGTVRIWDAATGEPVDTTLNYPATVLSMTAGRIGRRDVIVTGSFDRTIRLWDASTGLRIGEPMMGHATSVACVALGRVSGRNVIVSGSGDRTVRIWDAPTDEAVPVIPTGSRSPIEAVAIGRANGRDVVIAGTGDGTVRIVDAVSGGTVGGVQTRGHGKINSVAIGHVAGADVIVAGCSNKTARMWNAVTGAAIAVLDGHDHIVRSVALGRIGDRDVIVTGAEYSTLRIWDAETYELLREMHVEGGAWSVALGRTGDRDILVCGSNNGQIHVWDAVTSQPIFPPLTGYSRPRLPGHAREVRCVAIGRGGDRELIASGTWEGTVRIWDAATGEPVGSPLAGHTDGIWSVAFGRAGNRDLVVTGSRDNTVRLWDAVTGALVGAPLTGHDDWVTSVAIGRAGDRDLIVSGSTDTALIAYEYRHDGA
ncbi:AAA family ATPase [Nonomuraea angiospora]|uniref:AAA family ATPase n=1 Tax=Nonomuraea angiospora TaxID=46172 RepID=UPI00331800E7